MATSGILIAIIADALALNPETVGVHLRNLRLASLLSRRGVGKSAATMTSLDAARLLLAAAGSLQAKDTVETVVGFGQLLSADGAQAAARGEDPSAFTLERALAAELMEVAARWPSPSLVNDWSYTDARWEADDSAVGPAPVLQLFTTLSYRQPVERAAVLRRFAWVRKGEEAALYFGGGAAPRATDEASFYRGAGASLTQSRTVAARALVHITRRL